jgi:hypothetical protein
MDTFQPQSSATSTPGPAERPEDPAEHFAGYAVLGQPFKSGHFLAFRDFPFSSVGPGYRAVWHRDPGGEWTIYATTAPELSCARYFGAAVQHTVTSDVDIQWDGPFTARIRVPGVVDWQLELTTSRATSILTLMALRMPEPLWRNDAVLRSMGVMAGLLLRAGRMKVCGVVPNGQTFQAQPRMLWSVKNSQATVLGEDAGVPGPLPVQDHLADFWLPQRGLFAAGVGIRFPSTARTGAPVQDRLRR